MFKKLCSAVLIALLTLPATAQNNPSPAPSGASPSAAGPSTMVGCIEKTGDAFTLSDETSKVTVQLRGSGLKGGRHVQVTGTRAANATPASGATAVLDVSSVKSVKGSCKAASAGSSYVGSPSATHRGKIIGAIVMGVIITGVAIEVISRQGAGRGGN